MLFQKDVVDVNDGRLNLTKENFTFIRPTSFIGYLEHMNETYEYKTPVGTLGPSVPTKDSVSKISPDIFGNLQNAIIRNHLESNLEIIIDVANICATIRIFHKHEEQIPFLFVCVSGNIEIKNLRKHLNMTCHFVRCYREGQ